MRMHHNNDMIHIIISGAHQSQQATLSECPFRLARPPATDTCANSKQTLIIKLCNNDENLSKYG